ncbi:hypothetical protein QTO34_012581 [Cnephaeus nilssonii]|uniref:Uncharacterized protein n=1 Tax=Cnephaeus nilssonii TaxID=3371016 RepID=A0AA40HBH8_CNENI|nr:hypothetical protein QTO34_012581 [Eptesicus nilssonii]
MLGITDSVQVKWHGHLHAAEAAEVILRVDDIIKAAPRKGTQGTGPSSCSLKSTMGLVEDTAVNDSQTTAELSGDTKAAGSLLGDSGIIRRKVLAEDISHRLAGPSWNTGRFTKVPHFLDRV